MDVQRKKQVDTMKIAAPAFKAPKEFAIQREEYRKQASLVEDQVNSKFGPRRFGSRGKVTRKAQAYHRDLLEKLRTTTPRLRMKDARVDQKVLSALHEAGKNIENIGAINKDTRTWMLDRARPLPNPTKSTQLGLKVFMNDQYQRHLKATTRRAVINQLMAHNNALPPLEHLNYYGAKGAVNFLSHNIRYQREALDSVGLRDTAREWDQPHKLNKISLMWQDRTAKEKMQNTGSNIKKVGMINKGMRQHMLKLGPIANPDRRPPRRPKRKRQGG
ncbi:hypothetical protein MMC10_000272 [Thelotrema lepadinum]|nr:hypothetical protein [Thelotrema lepadinum]